MYFLKNCDGFESYFWSARWSFSRGDACGQVTPLLEVTTPINDLPASLV